MNTQTGQATAVKVPAATLSFWVLKILTTGMGETASDWLARSMDPVLAVAGSALVLAALLATQLLARGYRAWLYWGTVAMVSVFGTMAADVAHVVLGVPYLVSSVAFATTLGWGYLAAGVLFAVAFALPVLAHRFAGLDVVVALWPPPSSPARWVPRSPTGSPYRPDTADSTSAPARSP